MKKTRLGSSFACLLVASSAAIGGMSPQTSFEVSDSGSANYTIPIQVPPGVAGMAPQLAISYNSQTSNALLGVGWNISGLSAIHRCPRTLAQDDFRGKVAFDTDDRFCLDGQRLVNISGTYGANGTEYRTEIETFSKVISYGTAGSGPAYFIVKTKAGLTMEYGNTADSRVEAQGKTSARAWALNKVSDSVGNYMSFTYYESADSSDHVIASIQYGGNSVAGKAHTQSVVFTRKARQDIERFYLVGSLITDRYLISSIKTYSNSVLVKEYKLFHRATTSTASARSLLERVQECTGAGACRDAVSASYSTLTNTFSSKIWTVASTAGWSTSGYNWTDDFNGDGRTDIASAANGNVYLKLSTGTGFSSVTWPVQSTWGSPVWTWSADFNGDGKADIASASGGNVYMKLSTGTGFTSQTWPVTSQWSTSGYDRIGDFNGDGRADIATPSGSNVYMKLSTGTGFTSTTWPVTGSWGASTYTWAADFNGDGLTDLASASGSNVYMKLSTGSGFVSQTWTVASNWSTSAAFNWIGDFNGDGLMDIASGVGSNVYVKLSKGTGFQSETWPVSSSWGSGDFTRVGDFNGDGRSDIASWTGSNVYMKLSNSWGMRSETWTVSGTWGGSEFTWLGDFDGDGLADWASASGSNVHMKMSSAPRDFVTRFVDLLGVSHTPTYAALPSVFGTSYLKEFSPSYPLVAPVPGLPVVITADTTNGVGGTRRTRYKYGTAVSDTTGRGFLGFKWTQTHDEATGLISRKVYRQDWPYTGMVEQAGTGHGGSWTNLKLSTTTYKCFNYMTSTCTPSPRRRYFVYPDLVREKSWDLNGVALPWLETVQVFETTYGNATSTTVSTRNPDGSATGYSKTTTNVYANDAAKWHLGRLLKSTVTSTAP